MSAGRRAGFIGAALALIGVMTMASAAIFWQLDRGTPVRSSAAAAVDET